MKKIIIILLSTFGLFLIVLGIMFIIKIWKIGDAIIFANKGTNFLLISCQLTKKQYLSQINDQNHKLLIYHEYKTNIGYIYVINDFQLSDKNCENIKIYLKQYTLFNYLLKG